MQVLGLIKETEASYVSSEDEHSTILIDMSQLGDEPQQLPAGVQLGIKDSDGNIRMMELVGDGNRDVMIVRESGGKDGDVEGRGMGVVVRGVGENQGLRHSPRKRKRRKRDPKSFSALGGYGLPSTNDTNHLRTGVRGMGSGARSPACLPNSGRSSHYPVTRVTFKASPRRRPSA